MKENFTYPSIMYREKGEDKFYIRFPDFPGLCVFGETQQEAVQRAQKELAMVLITLIDERKTVPEPGRDGGTGLAGGEQLVYIQLWLPYFRSIMKEIYVKKSVTVPSWLDELAKNKNLNFSAALVRGLKEELGITN